MNENHWFQIGFLFCAGFAAGWVLRSARPIGNRIGAALVLTSLALMQVPDWVAVEPPHHRIFLWAGMGIAVLAFVVMMTMRRRQSTTAA